jgi:hypothetical protein
LIADAIPEDVFMEVKQLPMSWLSQDSLKTLTHPTVCDILESYSQSPLCERTDSVPYENSDRKFAFFRYLASSNRSLWGPYADSKAPIDHQNHTTTHRRRPSDFNDLSTGKRAQRRTHAMYANAILGIAILEQSSYHDGAGEMSHSFQLTTFLFPGERIIGKEKALVSNTELEERMNKQLYRLRYLPLCDRNELRKRIRKDVQRSGRIALKLLYTQRAWDQLYTPSPPIPSNHGSDSDLFQALSFHSKIISLKFLQFICPSLLRLVAVPEDQHLFLGILQRVFRQRLTYLLVKPRPLAGEDKEANIQSLVKEQDESHDKQQQDDDDTSTEHYLITGAGSGQELSTVPGNGRYVIDIQITNRKSCEIRLIESQGSCSRSNEEKYQQQKLIENLVDVILYAVGVVCEDEVKLIVS